MNTKTIILSLATSLLALSQITVAATNKTAVAKVPAIETFGSGKYQSFIQNWDEKANEVLYALIQSGDQWDAVFHPAPVMGGKREFGPDKERFEKEQLVVVARVVPQPGKEEVFTIESVSTTNGELTVRYMFKEPKAATSMAKSFIGVWVPKAEYKCVVLIENGKQIGKLEPANGTWSVPAMKQEKEEK